MKIRANKQIIESILINLQPFLEKKDGFNCRRLLKLICHSEIERLIE